MNGSWAAARFLKATEIADPAGLAQILNEIRSYNEEDLNATYAVFDWLKNGRQP
jgi:predicted RecB family nuclease